MSGSDTGMPNSPPPAWREQHLWHWIIALLLLVTVAVMVWLWWPRPSNQDEAEHAETPAPETPITADDIREAYTRVVPAAQRLPFFGPFRSYMSVDAAERALDAAGHASELRSHHPKVPDGIPPSNIDTLRVSAYRHLDVNGKLELQFFNDRLYQLEFEPEDAASYRNAFRARWPQLRREQSGRAEATIGALRIASSLDLTVSEVGQVLHTRPFVLWQDLRLVAQRDDWNYQFARQTAE